MITDSKKRPRWLIDIEISAVFLLQCLASLAVNNLMFAFSFFFADIVVPLPARVEYLLALHGLGPLLYPLPPAITLVLWVYSFWKRRKPDYDLSRILFFIGLCAFIQLLLTILLFMYVGPIAFELGLP